MSKATSTALPSKRLKYAVQLRRVRVEGAEDA
jgi:hypothetical protein